MKRTARGPQDPATIYPPIEPLRPPEGAPNVLLILLDDVGFGAASAFGGPCQTPTAERLADNGLRYNRFHTTALCSPTRAAILSGRNHHTVGMGGITEMATSAPGYSSMRPDNCAPLAETLKLNGYSTAQLGKCHEVPVWENGPTGPFARWPSPGNGFEYFYGFIGGETNQYYPALYEGATPVEPPKTPEQGYHLTEDLTDHAILWARQQKSLMPDKPFYLYFAPGATHAPHHVPKEWSAKYKGQFDQGWDKLREEIFARQKALGVLPQDAELTRRHEEIPAWDEMPEQLKPVLARQMEIYAGFLEHTDYHIGRLIDALEDLGALENTLIYYIIGDNGASAEGTVQGTFNFLSAAAILGALLAFGIDFPFLWAFLAFFLGYIPMIGLLIACIPAIFLAFIQYGLGTDVVLLLLIILLNTAMDNLVTPRFMGDGLNLPIVFIMIGFIFWGWIYGPLGALLAVPLTLLVRALFESSRATRFQARLMTSVEEPDSAGAPSVNGASPSVAVIAPPGGTPGGEARSDRESGGGESS